MTEFDFYQDIKVTVWCRQHFSIEAETESEALELAGEFTKKDIATSDDAHLIHDTEWMYNTWEDINPEENEGRATISLFQKNGNFIGDNKLERKLTDIEKVQMGIEKMKKELIHKIIVLLNRYGGSLETSNVQIDLEDNMTAHYLYMYGNNPMARVVYNNDGVICEKEISDMSLGRVLALYKWADATATALTPLDNFAKRHGMDKMHVGLDEEVWFTCCRITDEIPQGLYRYSLRAFDEDDSQVAAIEEKVMVNHYGDILLDHPLQTPILFPYEEIPRDEDGNIID